MCANVGETQCYLIKKNSVLKLSKTHRCPDKEEGRSRKNKQNRAMVFNKRVFGSLMLIRSIDAREMKQYGVSSINYTKSNDNDIFFVIASDGFWDVIDQNDIFDIYKYHKSINDNSKDIIQKIIHNETKDKVCCIVI